MDRISKLPTGIIETILCLLPIKEAARTSILSSEWRYHWIKIPKLEFIRPPFKSLPDEAEMYDMDQTPDQRSGMQEMTRRWPKLFNDIYQVLLMHEGPIYEFALSTFADESCVEIDHIILHLSKKHTIKILKLEVCGLYVLPTSFFSLHQLTELHLTSCAIQPRPSFNGFGSLTTLVLQDIRTCRKTLIWFLTNCPSLKRVTLSCDGEIIDDCGDCTIADLIKSLRGIEYLSVYSFIFTCFLPLPKEIPATLVHLKCLCVELVWLRHKDAGPFLVLLIKSSPHLEKLKLEICCIHGDESVLGSFTPEDYSDIRLEHLRELEILDLTNEKNELALVKLILANSPLLKNARIRILDKFNEDERLEISKALLSYPCASSAVKIIVS